MRVQGAVCGHGDRCRVRQGGAHLAGGLVVRAHHQLHAVGLELVLGEELDDVQLCGVKRQALDLDDAVRMRVAVVRALRGSSKPAVNTALPRRHRAQRRRQAAPSWHRELRELWL